MSLLVALHVSEVQRLGSQGHRDSLFWTRVLVATIACLFAAALLVLGIGSTTSNNARLADHVIIIGEYAAVVVAMLALAAYGLRRASQAHRRGQVLRGFHWTYAAYAAIFCITSIIIFPTVDRWQDLPRLAAQIHTDTQDDSLALLDPDETTVAMLDRRLRTSFVTLTTDARSSRRVVSDWFAAHGASARVLVLLPGHAPGELTPLLEGVHLGRPAGDGEAGELQAEGSARIVRRYELPHGRRYALLGPE